MKIAQFDPAGKDAYQVRARLFDYLRSWFLRSGMDSRQVNSQLDKIFHQHLDPLILDASLSGTQKAQLEYDAKNRIEYPLASSMSPEELDSVMSGYRALLDEFKKNASTLPSLSFLSIADPAEQEEERQRAQFGYKLMSRISRLLAAEPDAKLNMRDYGNGSFGFYFDTADGEIELTSEPLRFDDPAQAELAYQNLYNKTDILSRVQAGGNSREADAERFRLLSSDPFDVPYGVDEEDIAGKGPQGPSARASIANLAISATVPVLRESLSRTQDLASKLRAKYPTADLSTITSMLSGLISDLVQSSMALRQMMAGKKTLDLPAVKASWGRKKFATNFPPEAYEIRVLLQEVTKTLQEMVTRLTSDTGMSDTGSWVRQAAGSTSPKALAPVAPPEAAAPKGPGQMVAQQPQDDGDRLLRWEIALAAGAANRAIREISDILEDTNFWYQFTSSGSPFEGIGQTSLTARPQE